MTITRRPPRTTSKPATARKAPVAKKTPEAFIEDAHHAAAAPAPEPAVAATPDATVGTAAEPAAKPAKKSKDKVKEKEKEKDKEKGKSKRKGKAGKDKEAVLIRFEDDQLTMMDARATELGLSRAAWLRMVVAKALMTKKR